MIAPAKKILIVDDYPVVREGLAALISQQKDLSVCAQAADLAAARLALRQTAPDLAVVDLSLKGESGLDLVKEMRSRWPGLPVLVLSMHDEKLFAERALRAGARGYLTKQVAAQEIIAAIRRILAGDVYLSAPMTTRMLERVADSTRSPAGPEENLLSDRELQVFELIGSGLGTREIAGKLKLSVKTIETYREHIKEKLGVGSAARLAQRAACWLQSQPQR